MRAKCPSCHAVFEVKLGPSLIHLGPYRSTKCPACGKRSFTNNFVDDPITWPPEAVNEGKAPPMSDKELKEKRLDDSKYESGES